MNVRRPVAATVVTPGLLYFVLVFGAGFVFGFVRVLWLVPRVGVRAAELAEMPLMLVAIVLAARWTNARFPGGAPSRVGRGILAAALVLAADFVVGVALRGIPPAEVFTGRDPVSGAAYYGMVVAFAAMPWLLGRRAPA